MPTIIHRDRRGFASLPGNGIALVRRNTPDVPVVPARGQSLSHHNLYILEAPQTPDATMPLRAEGVRRTFRTRLEVLR